MTLQVMDLQATGIQNRHLRRPAKTGHAFRLSAITLLDQLASGRLGRRRGLRSRACDRAFPLEAELLAPCLRIT